MLDGHPAWQYCRDVGLGVGAGGVSGRSRQHRPLGVITMSSSVRIRAVVAGAVLAFATLAGFAPHDGGKLIAHGKTVTLRSPAEAVDIGVGYIPRERRVEGSSVGAADISASVYGCVGWSKTSSVGPVSMMRPRYMTATRSATCRTTDRSCEMKT